MKTPLPTLAQAFPRLAAQIDTERPLIARAIADHVTVEWDAEHIRFYVSDASSFQLLSTSAQHSYLIALCSTIGFDLRILDNSTQPTPETKHQEPETTLPRRYNTLTFRERMKLQAWMQEPDNTHFVAHESDSEAAIKASADLDPTHITSANIGSMRKILGITKIKPERTPPLPLAPDVDLVALTHRVSKLEDYTSEIVAINIPQAITQLRRLVDELTSRLAALETATA